MIVDPIVAEMYWSRVPSAIYAGSYLFPCAQNLPSFSVDVGRKGHSVTIPGAQLNYAPVNDHYCYGGVQSNGGNSLQIYGDLLLRQSFVVFYGDGAELGLGFAEKTGN